MDHTPAQKVTSTADKEPIEEAQMYETDMYEGMMAETLAIPGANGEKVEFVIFNDLDIIGDVYSDPVAVQAHV